MWTGLGGNFPEIGPPVELVALPHNPLGVIDKLVELHSLHLSLVLVAKYEGERVIIDDLPGVQRLVLRECRNHPWLWFRAKIEEKV